MRLLDTTTLTLHEVHGDCTEPYAILSHTWGDEECRLQDMASPNVKSRKGYLKIKYCCDQAVKDGLQWAWVDTCCIDKTSTAELTEAINSMFRWYKQAQICYAYLEDVTGIEQLATSRWFTRGWTLQELIAPSVVQFFSSTWTLLGAKNDTPIAKIVSGITGIELSVLLTGAFYSVCVARRMAWAASRQTTRIEDQAYSLMGLFGVNMPLIYGEGKKAFLRLQQQILLESEDLSILAWGMPQRLDNVDSMAYHASHAPRLGPFAESPSDFGASIHVSKPLSTNFYDPMPPAIVGSAITIKVGVFRQTMGIYLILPCTTVPHPDSLLAIPVTDWGAQHYERSGPLKRVCISEGMAKDMMEVVSFRQQPRAAEITQKWSEFRFCRIPNTSRSNAVALQDIFWAPSVRYDEKENAFKYPDGFKGVIGAIMFTPTPLLEEVQTKGQVPGMDKMRSFAIILAVFSKPRFAIIYIGTEAESASTTNSATSISRCKLTRHELKSYIEGNAGKPENLHFAYAFQGQCLLKAVHDLPGSGKWLKRTQAEQLRIMLRVVLMTASVDYLNKAHFLCIDVAGEMSHADQVSQGVRGGVNTQFTKPDWQALKEGGGFQPLLADIVSKPAPKSISWCSQRWCLVCNFGSRGWSRSSRNVVFP